MLLLGSESVQATADVHVQYQDVEVVVLTSDYGSPLWIFASRTVCSAVQLTIAEKLEGVCTMCVGRFVIVFSAKFLFTRAPTVNNKIG